jgi:hypothetical protein
MSRKLRIQSGCFLRWIADTWLLLSQYGESLENVWRFGVEAMSGQRSAQISASFGNTVKAVIQIYF